MRPMAAIRAEGGAYVVYWYEQDYTQYPLRSFGSWQSAAIEFCRYLNREHWERKEAQIEGWRKTFDPQKHYSYPEFSPKWGITLKKQQTKKQQ